jgi:hypothetical protein
MALEWLGVGLCIEKFNGLRFRISHKKTSLLGRILQTFNTFNDRTIIQIELISALKYLQLSELWASSSIILQESKTLFVNAQCAHDKNGMSCESSWRVKVTLSNPSLWLCLGLFKISILRLGAIFIIIVMNDLTASGSDRSKVNRTSLSVELSYLKAISQCTINVVL